MSHRGLILLAACALGACASGPHPALQIASRDLDCEQSALRLHQIYPKKVRIEGCGRQGIYVDGCSGYGMDEKCGWGRHYESAFERDIAEREKAERAEAGQHRAEQEKAEHEKAEQEKAERSAVEHEKAEQEKAERAAAKPEKAEHEKAEPEEAEHENAGEEKATAKKSREDKADGEHASAEADEAKPERKSGKKPKPAKKDEGIESFLK
jgi:flagellar biosynthesis GTPase FlhF